MIEVKKNEIKDISLKIKTIVVDPEATDMGEEELLALLKEKISELNDRLPAFKRISGISLATVPFPRNGAGKLLRDFAG